MKRSMILATLAVLTLGTTAGGAEKRPFKISGLYTETCSCRALCPCEITGLMKGCKGLGAMQLTGGSYDGHDLTGVKAAYASEPGKWVRLYVQTAKPEQREAAVAFLTAVFTPWGKIESVKDASIDIGGEGGNITVSVDGGKVMKYRTEVVRGADGKTAVAVTNVKDPLNTTFKLGLSAVVSTYGDGDHKFNLPVGRNAYFNDKMEASGEL